MVEKEQENVSNSQKDSRELLQTQNLEMRKQLQTRDADEENVSIQIFYTKKTDIRRSFLILNYKLLIFLGTLC